jgi:type IV fimbrial biogenesis protein FimT
MVELIVVIAIAAILASIAAPGFQGMLRDVSQKSTVNLLLADLNLARGEAIKRSARVLVCARNAAGTDCAASANWQVGWVVCLEDVNNPMHCAGTTAASPNPVAVRPAISSQLTLVKAGTSNATDAVRFSGNSNATSATLAVGGVWTGAAAQTVSIFPSGSISK